MKKRRDVVSVITLLLILLLIGTAVPYAEAEESPVLLSSLTQAQDFAAKFIEKEYPFAKGSFVVEDSRVVSMPPNENHYYFQFKRVIDGIPYPNNFINLDIDQRGTIISKQIFWNKELKLPKTENVLNIENAKLKLIEQMKPYVSAEYPDRINHGEQKTGFYSYRLAQETAIDAITGELIEDEEGLRLATQKPIIEHPIDNAILPVPTAEEALKRASSFAMIPSGSEKPNVFSESVGFNNAFSGPFWRVNWVKKVGDTYCSSYVQLQQGTGELIYYFNDCKIEGHSPINEEEAKKIAIEFIKQYVPRHAHQLVLSEVRQNKVTIQERRGAEEYSVYFTQNVPGARGGYVIIGIDKESGKVSLYSNSLHELNYDDMPYFNEDSLKMMLMKKYDLQLSYRHDTDKSSISKAWKEGTLQVVNNEPVEARLVYGLVNKDKYLDYFLDAKDAVWRHSLTSEVTSEEKIKSAQR
ncbi:YcdB/YcdC domain-containing protein [Paenibacillus sp. 32352]|uniref:YcdB/YcdC domain-containing protein n=1 Tax=Paenibacillus sp. 32352 TaxID=1969111 RepID=UPI0009ACC678|nr:YcdB/YcdC domain-containing protein [Paenibacillus sp. 32352]